jgi:hypothetical protein
MLLAPAPNRRIAENWLSSSADARDETGMAPFDMQMWSKLKSFCLSELAEFWYA